MNLWQLLRKRFPENEYALMAEVSNASGFARSNSADYIAVNLWPSRGLAVNGIELKSFRNDWLRELKKPDKAEEIFKYCEFFWLLTTNEDIAKIEEIPAAWGWLCVKGDKIIMKKQAPALTPLPITKSFMCAMLRRAADKTNFVHINSIQDKIAEAEERAKLDRTYKLDHLQKEHDDLKKIVNDFEKASGIRISYRWEDPIKTGEAVKFVLSGGTTGMKKELDDLKRTSESILFHIEQSLKIYEQDNKQDQSSTNGVELGAAMERSGL